MEKKAAIDILVADDEANIRESLAAFLDHSGYRVLLASDGKSALESFRNHLPPLVLTDLRMPGMSGYDLLLGIKKIEPETEVVIITGYATIDSAVQAIKAGAYDYIIKPFKMNALCHVLEKARGHQELIRSNRRLQENSLNVLRAMVNVIEQKDEYTAGHSQRVTEIANVIAAHLSLSEEELKTLGLAGPIHDLGKIGIEDNILRKPDRLTLEEYTIIKSHPERGVTIIEPLDFLQDTIPLVRNHHERFDGTGYPEGLAGEDIPLGARILTVADTYDAMTSSRAYRSARTKHFAMEELERCKGTQFDPDLVDLFFEISRSSDNEIFEAAEHHGQATHGTDGS